MKLVCLNVGLFLDNNQDLSKFISEQKADIWCLQEVVRDAEGKANPKYISKEVIDAATRDFTGNFFAPVWLITNFRKDDFHGKKHFVFELGGEGELGNYIKSRYKLLKGENVFVQNHYSYITDWSKWPEEDFRAVEVADLDIEGKPLRVMSYHGIWSKGKKGNDKTIKACRMIKQLGKEAAGAVIICGDFNLFPDTESMKVLSDSFVSLVDKYAIRTTRPESNELSGEARNVVDYIFVNEKVEVNKFEVLKSEVSDHLPLVLEFELK